MQREREVLVIYITYHIILIFHVCQHITLIINIFIYKQNFIIKIDILKIYVDTNIIISYMYTIFFMHACQVGLVVKLQSTLALERWPISIQHEETFARPYYLLEGLHTPHRNCLPESGVWSVGFENYESQMMFKLIYVYNVKVYCVD